MHCKYGGMDVCMPIVWSLFPFYLETFCSLNTVFVSCLSLFARLSDLTTTAG
ncbi:hypothetical protein BDV24DRAFT_83078 [Aspergillus arachidicola]|uniref:Uncharacterized protein n=1 Tax=Aspergillus arachidicola TaxID=656916 RepID=A0A5N6Y2X3_9EURO|nr:hypothetical protein BDV24DRAFT_83078 [Aspergillus arachidicola]